MTLALPITVLDGDKEVVRFNTKPRGVKTMVTERLRQKIAEKLVEKVDGSLDLMVDGMVEAATGFEQVVINNGHETVIRQKPDAQAFKALMEYVISKAPEKKDIKVAVGIVNLISSLEKGDEPSGGDDEEV